LVQITPGDDGALNYPLYQRAAMRKDTAPMIDKTRFVAEGSIKFW
jgi:hypothetical protein